MLCCRERDGYISPGFMESLRMRGGWPPRGVSGYKSLKIRFLYRRPPTALTKKRIYIYSSNNCNLRHQPSHLVKLFLIVLRILLRIIISNLSQADLIIFLFCLTLCLAIHLGLSTCITTYKIIC